jgi:hypothetical protein
MLSNAYLQISVDTRAVCPFGEYILSKAQPPPQFADEAWREIALDVRSPRIPGRRANVRSWPDAADGVPFPKIR